MNLKRERYQQGSLTIERRTNGPDVWVYRWRKAGIRRKKILGTVKDLTKTQAQKKAISRTEDSSVVSELTNLNVSELLEHYKARELREDSGRAAKPRKAYLYIFANYILPTWGSLSLGQVKAVAVEDWLKTLPLANGSKAKIREVFGAAFRHAMRHELHSTNPIANVRQVRKRAIEPEILEPEEIAAILKQLEGVEPVRTAFLIAAVMGMRRGEIFGLKWSDVDLDHALLHVRRSYVDGVEGPPKTESSRRPLPLPPQVIDALNAWKAISKYTKQD
jgi:integrase